MEPSVPTVALIAPATPQYNEIIYPSWTSSGQCESPDNQAGNFGRALAYSKVRNSRLRIQPGVKMFTRLSRATALPYLLMAYALIASACRDHAGESTASQQSAEPGGLTSAPAPVAAAVDNEESICTVPSTLTCDGDHYAVCVDCPCSTALECPEDASSCSAHARVCPDRGKTAVVLSLSPGIKIPESFLRHYVREAANGSKLLESHPEFKISHRPLPDVTTCSTSSTGGADPLPLPPATAIEESTQPVNDDEESTPSLTVQTIEDSSEDHPPILELPTLDSTSILNLVAADTPTDSNSPVYKAIDYANFVCKKIPAKYLDPSACACMNSVANLAAAVTQKNDFQIPMAKSTLEALLKNGPVAKDPHVVVLNLLLQNFIKNFDGLHHALIENGRRPSCRQVAMIAARVSDMLLTMQALLDGGEMLQKYFGVEKWGPGGTGTFDKVKWGEVIRDGKVFYSSVFKYLQAFAALTTCTASICDSIIQLRNIDLQKLEDDIAILGPANSLRAATGLTCPQEKPAPTQKEASQNRNDGLTYGADVMKYESRLCYWYGTWFQGVCGIGRNTQLKCEEKCRASSGLCYDACIDFVSSNHCNGRYWASCRY